MAFLYSLAVIALATLAPDVGVDIVNGINYQLNTNMSGVTAWFIGWVIIAIFELLARD